MAQVDRAAARVATLRAYRRVRLVSALRCQIRNRIFDPDRVLRYLPASGRVLDWGCGDGFLAHYISATHADLSVLGVDTSESKRMLAERARTSPRARFIGGAPPQEPFEAVLLIDLLHHVPGAAHEGIVRDACARVAPGGVLVLKEVDAGHPFRNLLNQAHDLIWSRQWVHARSRAHWKSEVARHGLTLIDEVDCFTFGYPHFILVFRADRSRLHGETRG